MPESPWQALSQPSRTSRSGLSRGCSRRKVTIERIIALRQAHPDWTMIEIGNALGVSRQWVCKVLRKVGLPTSAQPPRRGGRRRSPIVQWRCGYCGQLFDIPQVVKRTRLRRSKSGEIFCPECKGRHRRITSFAYQLLRFLKPGDYKLLPFSRNLRTNLTRARAKLRREGISGIGIHRWKEKMLIVKRETD